MRPVDQITTSRSDHHFPVDVPRVRLLNPVEDEHPAAMVVGQPTSESTALGFANGAKDPVTVPFLMVILFIAAAPLKLKFEGCFQGVGVLPLGVVQVILNMDPATGAGSAEPLKMVAQLLAPAKLKPSDPVIAPATAMPVVATHGLAELPRVALTTTFSAVAVPPFKSAGENWMVPLQTPLAGLHETVPVRTVVWYSAPAVPPSTVMNRNDTRPSAAITRAIFLVMSISRPIESPGLSGRESAQCVTAWREEQPLLGSQAVFMHFSGLQTRS